MSPILEARGLDGGYGPEARVVRGLDLEVRRGEVVALLGANGAGKTTTMRTLAGELPPLAGEVCTHGAPDRSPYFRRARRGLGFVTDERAVLMSLTVSENLRVGRCDVDAAFDLFPELAEHVDRKVRLLSGGQQQMLSLAIALARRPQILLVDELSLGLAPILVDRLLATLRAAADSGVGILVVEQHVHKALAVADRVYVMQRGEIRLSGPAAEVAADIDSVQRAYLSFDAAAR